MPQDPFFSLSFQDMDDCILEVFDKCGAEPHVDPWWDHTNEGEYLPFEGIRYTHGRVLVDTSEGEVFVGERCVLSYEEWEEAPEDGYWDTLSPLQDRLLQALRDEWRVNKEMGIQIPTPLFSDHEFGPGNTRLRVVTDEAEVPHWGRMVRVRTTGSNDSLEGLRVAWRKGKRQLATLHSEWKANEVPMYLVAEEFLRGCVVAAGLRGLERAKKKG